MGDRVSAAEAPASNNTSSKLPSTVKPPTSRRSPAKFQPRRLFVSFGVLTLGALFFVYSRTSIQAAKENAKRAREADGGTINWRNEGLRRHGALEKPQERTLWQQLFNIDDLDDVSKERRAKENKRLEMEGRKLRRANPIEDGIRRAKDKDQVASDKPK